MRAGILRERLELIACERIQDLSGAVRKVDRSLCTVRCAKLKQVYRYDRDGVVGKEEFEPMGARFLIRYTSQASEAYRLRYRGVLYRITMQDYNPRDRSISLHAERINV